MRIFSVAKLQTTIFEILFLDSAIMHKKFDENFLLWLSHFLFVLYFVLKSNKHAMSSYCQNVCAWYFVYRHHAANMSNLFHIIFLNVVFRSRDNFCLTNLSHKNALNRCWASLSLLGIIPQTRYEGAHIYTYIFGKMGFWISNRISIALSKSQVRRFTAAILKHRRHLSAIKIIRHFQLAHIINTNVLRFHKKKKKQPKLLWLDWWLIGIDSKQ